MPDYHFTGAFPRLLAGLSQGVNAWLTPADDDAPPFGSTLEARTGDTIHTTDPYAHPELEEFVSKADLIEGPQAVVDAAAPGADGIDVLRAAAAAASPESTPAEPVVPIQLVAAPEPAPEPDPAHEAMTAEGAPAPAETN